MPILALGTALLAAACSPAPAAFDCGCDNAEPRDLSRGSLILPADRRELSLPANSRWRQWTFPEGAILHREKDGQVWHFQAKSMYLGTMRVGTEATEGDFGSVELHANGLPRDVIALEAGTLHGMKMEVGRTRFRTDGTIAAARVSGTVPGTSIECRPLCVARWNTNGDLELVEPRTRSPGDARVRVGAPQRERRSELDVDGAHASAVSFEAGAPRTLLLARRSRVGGLSCAGRTVVWLHKNGEPELCVLAQDAARAGWHASAFTTVLLDEEGRRIEPPPFDDTMLGECRGPSLPPMGRRTCILKRTARYDSVYLAAGTRFSWLIHRTGEILSISGDVPFNLASGPCSGVRVGDNGLDFCPDGFPTSGA